jgi:integrase
MTGLRQDELLGLRWLDIDLLACRAHVRCGFPCSQHSRTTDQRITRILPLPIRLKGELEAHHRRALFGEGEDLIFCDPLTGGKLDPAKVRRRFREALRRAGLGEQVGFDDLRQTFESRCVAAGAPIAVIKKWMGDGEASGSVSYADLIPSASEQNLIEVAFAMAVQEASGLR